MTRRPAVIFKPQTLFYVGADAAERRNPLVLSPREWKMLWLSYCITSLLVILTVFLCLKATQPVYVVYTPDQATVRKSAPPAPKATKPTVRYAFSL